MWILSGENGDKGEKGEPGVATDGIKGDRGENGIPGQDGAEGNPIMLHKCLGQLTFSNKNSEVMVDFYS